MAGNRSTIETVAAAAPLPAWRARVVALVTTTLLAAACGSGPQAESTGAAGSAAATGGASSTVAIALADDPGALNPFQTLGQAAFQTFEFLYDNLIKMDENGELLPNLASEWTYEGNVATFTIREGITCSDGSPVTASVIADNFAWVQDPANESAQIGLTFPDADFTVAADDQARTVTITLSEPTDYFLQALASLFPIVCGAGLEDPETLATVSSGSGPYVLEEAVPGDHYRLVRRDEYAWGPYEDTDIASLPAEIDLRIVANETTAANLLESGELQAAVVNGPDRQRLTGDGYGNVRTPIGGRFMLFSQQDGRPTVDERVRRALVAAVDVPQVATVVTQGLADEPPTSIMAGQPVYCGPNESATDVLPAHDPEAAADLLDEAGWEEGDAGTRQQDGEPLELDVVYQTTTPGNEEGVQLIAEAWEALGIGVALRPITDAEQSELMFETGNYDVMPLTAARPPVPTPLVGLFTSPPPPEGVNAARIDNPEFAERAAAALSTADHEEACEHWFAAENALYAQVDYIPVADDVMNWITRDITFATNGSHIIPMSIAPLP